MIKSPETRKSCNDFVHTGYQALDSVKSKDPQLLKLGSGNLAIYIVCATFDQTLWLTSISARYN